MDALSPKHPCPCCTKPIYRHLVFCKKCWWALEDRELRLSIVDMFETRREDPKQWEILIKAAVKLLRIKGLGPPKPRGNHLRIAPDSPTG